MVGSCDLYTESLDFLK